jgi:alkylhydroperoxidase family enzyme
VHGRALQEFLSEAQVLAIAEGRCETLSEAEQALVAFARQTIVDATQTTEDHVAALKRHGYSDGEIFDVAAVVAGRAYFAKLLDALGTLPDSSLMALDEPFRRALTIGRPIDQAACVTMEMPQPFDR